VIVPSSRVAYKRMSEGVIARLAAQLEAFGPCSVINLEGEECVVPPGITVCEIERTFTALIRTLRKVDLVVSADSLSAHLAEYLGIPTYVVTPVPNEYWLPLLAFERQAWCLFGEEFRLGEWLRRTWSLNPEHAQ
jgi:ADP-heptose:LPS heptosyltransferase